MDARIGSKELNLQYMKGNSLIVGFQTRMSECRQVSHKYHSKKDELATKGYKVLIVEQTETPYQLEIRCKELGSKDKFEDDSYRHWLCSILNKFRLVEIHRLLQFLDALAVHIGAWNFNHQLYHHQC